MDRTYLTALANETMEIIEQGFYRAGDGSIVRIATEMDRAVAGTRLYRPDDFPDTIEPAPLGVSTIFEVTGETSLEAAARLIREESLPVLCLNFASAKKPGGGFLNGRQAQEESLARASGLYPTLIQMKEMYDYHHKQGTSLYSDYMIYSPDVPVFRKDDGELLDACYPVTFLTSAAANAGAIRRNEAEKLKHLPEVMKKRLQRVLWVARQHRHDTLVLGAWGCGVFENDPRMIAELFYEALGPEGIFSGTFSRVVFAVYDRSPGQETLNAFSRVFS